MGGEGGGDCHRMYVLLQAAWESINYRQENSKAVNSVLQSGVQIPRGPHMLEVYLLVIQLESTDESIR